MTKLMVPARPRGLIAHVRNDAAVTLPQIHAEMKKTMKEFRDSVDEELKGIKNQFDDVVTKDKVEKINAEVANLEKAIADANSMMARVAAGGAGGDDPEADLIAPEVRQARSDHAKAFHKFFRAGDSSNLGPLQVKAELSTDINEGAGWLTPIEWDRNIDQIARDQSVMRSVARQMSISATEYRKLINMGGSTAQWVGEREERDETDTPTLRELILQTHELSAEPHITQTLLDDAAFDVIGWLSEEVRLEFVVKESDSFVLGDGNKKPRGLWTYPFKANSSWSAVADWGKFGYVPSGKADGFLAPTATVSPADCLVDLVYALRQQYRAGASFIMNDKTALTVRKFKDGDGNFLWREPTESESLPRLLGKPVYTDDYTPVVDNNAYPIGFGNWSRTYMILDRMGTRVLRDPYTRKPFVKFYTTKRVGGGVTHFETAKFLKIATS